MDDDGSKTLSLEEFTEGIKDFGLSFNLEDARSILEDIDTDHNGSVSFDELLKSLRPPMSQSRKEIIDKAFTKLDKTGDGVITVEDLRGVYNARQHPKYMNGDWTKDQVFRNFLISFDTPGDLDGKVTKEEFFNYYAGLGASIDNDAYFDLMMRNAWKL